MVWREVSISLCRMMDGERQSALLGKNWGSYGNSVEKMRSEGFMQEEVEAIEWKCIRSRILMWEVYGKLSMKRMTSFNLIRGARLQRLAVIQTKTLFRITCQEVISPHRERLRRSSERREKAVYTRAGL